MKPLISVVVPVYKIEPYIVECIESIIAQAYDNLEIILVDDGSPDNCGKICEDYSKKDNRIIVIHKENGGLSSARNAGIDIAKGEYIGFVDGDDWIEPDMYSLLYENLAAHQADISACKFLIVKERGKMQTSTPISNKTYVYNSHDALKVMVGKSKMGYSACNKLYRTSLFKQIRYPVGMLMEDKATTYKLIHNSDRIVFNHSRKYHYFSRDTSIMRSRFNERHMDSLSIHEELLSFISNNYPDLENLYRGRYVLASISLLLRMKRSGYENRAHIDQCVKIIKNNIKCCLANPDIELTSKVFAAGVYAGLRVLR